jgi:hypothetical protein
MILQESQPDSPQVKSGATQATHSLAPSACWVSTEPLTQFFPSLAEVAELEFSKECY